MARRCISHLLHHSWGHQTLCKHVASAGTVAALLHLCHTPPAPATALSRHPAAALLFYDATSDTFRVSRAPHVGLVAQPSEVVAQALFVDSYATDGWYRLEISVNAGCPVADAVKARGAGFLEGFLTAPQVYNYWYNYRVNEYKHAKVPGEPPAALRQYAVQQRQYLDRQVAAQPADPFWRGLALVLAQFDGLVAGYSAAAAPGQELDWVQLYLLQAVGDLYDLNVVYHDDHPRGLRVSEGHGLLGPGGPGDKLECSVLIKLQEEEEESPAAANSSGGGGYRNFWAAHTTWRPYYAMVRTYKVYDFPWAATGPVVIASSPGLLHSKDDWYSTDRFVILETTNGVYNQSLYSALTPHSALSWQRVQLANFNARSGAEWVALFRRENSGTYNNQWMVLDAPLAAQRAQQDVLWILEQLPGLTREADVTGVLLQQGYWPGYNVPYFPEVYDAAGYPQPSVYHTCPRARIFARDQGSVKDRQSIKRLIRYNAYQSDPLSAGLPSNAICSRYDLPPVEPDAAVAPDGAAAAADGTTPRRGWTPHAFGCVDGKAIDLHSLAGRLTDLVSGPTQDQQVPFSWNASGLADTAVHLGAVDTYNFSWVAWGPWLLDDDAPSRRDNSLAAWLDGVQSRKQSWH